MGYSKKLSLAVTTFNSEKYIEAYVDLVLNFRFPVEMIFVDDASTDSTREKILMLEQSLANYANEISVKHIFHTENLGISRSVNDALEVSNGKYFFQNDADDLILFETLEQMIQILDSSSYDMIQAGVEFLNGDRFSIKAPFDFSELTRKNRIKKIISGDGMIFQPGSRIFRLSSIGKLLPNGRIFPSKQGQNWQFLLPFCLNSDVFYLNQPSIIISEDNNSHSRKKRSIDDEKNRINEFYNIWEHSIVDISKSDFKVLNEVWGQMMMDLAVRYSLPEVAIDAFWKGSRRLSMLIKMILVFFDFRRFFR